MLLLQSIMTGQIIDVGKLTHDAIIGMVTSTGTHGPLLFPNLITTMCRQAQVHERPEDVVFKAPKGKMPYDIHILKELTPTTVAATNIHNVVLPSTIIAYTRP
ncbi:hypothetical protein V6N13_111102 [Hibiscus sabdariffa]